MMVYTVIQCLFLRKNAIPFLKEQKKTTKKAFTTRSREDAGEKLSVKNYKPIYFCLLDLQLCYFILSCKRCLQEFHMKPWTTFNVCLPQ